MKPGDIVQEKITGFKVIIIRSYGNRFFRWADGKDFSCRVWKNYGDGAGEWSERDYNESELEPIS